MSNKRNSNVVFFVKVFITLMMAIQPVAPAWAAPQGEQVVSGDVSFSRTGDLTQIQADHNSIINYSSFNILSHETVQFIQPNAMSRVLNRVQSIDPTHIDGSLLANGQVYITNPAGVYFGHGAFVDVGAIYAAAGNIANEDFLRGIDHFTDVTGTVTNLGTINADIVGLIGSHVANHGSITADEGIVMFLAGEDVYIGKIHNNIFVKIVAKNADTAAVDKTNAVGVENSGSVQALGGNVTFGAGDLYSMAIRTTGKVQAKEIDIDAGTGTVLVSGSLDASEIGEGGAGGNITITGKKVGLFETDVDASGDSGGGTVLIGGDYQGKGELPTAETTYVSGDSTIKADAVENGDGGKVIVWADGKTSYFGEISARGGADGGDGGFVEVSGKRSLTFAGKVDTRAPQGKTGTLLLDPTDIEIINSGHPSVETLDPADVNEFADPDLPAPPGTDGDTKIGIFALETTAANNNVILQATNDITFNEPVNMPNANAGITAQAGNDIIVNQSITTAGGSIVFSANDNGGGTATGTGSVDINAAIDTNGGSFTSSGDNFDNTGGTITATGGITISNDSATLAADLDGGGGLVSGSVNTVNVNSPGSIQDGIDIAANDATITVGDGTFTEDLVVSNVSGLTLESGNGMAATTIQLVDGVGIDIQSTAPTFTFGGDADDGFTILSGGATTFLTQLTNAPLGVTISNNTFDTTGNATQAISIGAAGATDLTISNNTINVITAGDGGIWGPEVIDITVSDNTLNGPGSYGIQFSGVIIDDGTSIISGNTINGFTGSGGIVISNGGGTADLTISGNTVTNSTYGLRIVEYSPVAPGNMTTVTVSGNTFTSNDKAIRIGDGAHVLSSNFVISDNNLSSSTTAGLDFDHTTESVDVTDNWWGNANGPDIAGNKFNTASHGVAITEAVLDSVTYTPWLDALGGSSFTPVTNFTQSTYHPSFEAGIAGAVAGDELRIETGTFDEAVTVDKNLQLTVAPGDTATMTSLSSNAPTNTGLAGDFEASSAAAAFAFDGTVSLENNVSLTSTADGSLTFDKDVTDSASNSLTIDTGTGSIDLNANVTANGGINLSGGTINVGNGVGTDKVTSNGAVVISATGTVTVNAEIDPTTVNITSEDDVTIVAAVEADTLIDIRAGTDNTGDVNIQTTGSLETLNAGSDINIEAGQPGGSGKVALDGLVKAVDQVTITSYAEAIEESAGSTNSKIEAAVATLTAKTNIGATGANEAIDTNVDTLTATAENTIVISNTGNITLGNVEASVDGSVLVTDSGSIIAEDVTATGAGRTVELTAGNNIEVHAISAPDAVELIATGSITDGDNTKKITASTLDMNAGTSIGADGAEIDTEITTLLNAITSGGDIYISEADGLTISNINANGGNDNVKLINANELGIGVGDAVVAGGLNISVATLGNISADVLELTSNNAGVINVDNIAAGDDATITTLKLTAGDTITFENNSSTINALTATAGNKIDVDVELQTDVGNMLFESAFEADHNLTAAGNMTLKGAGTLNGTAANQNQVISATGTLLTESTLTKSTAGNLTLSGGTGAVLGNNVVVNNGNLTITSDVNAEGLLEADGLVRLQGTNNNLAGNVTGVGITFDNAVTADGAAQTFDAGTGTLLAQAITKTTAGKLTLGGNADITLAGNVTSDDDITLDDDATATDGTQTIDAGAGTLSAQAINKTTAGKLTLSGDTGITLADNVTSNDDITLDDDATATGGTQTIDAGAGTLSAQAINKTTTGKLTLSGDTGITLSANVTGIDDITITDATTATGGIQTIDAGAGTLTVGVITKTTAGELTLGGDTGIALSGNVIGIDDITIADAATATGGVQTIDAGTGTLSVQAINKTTAGKLTLSGDTNIILAGNVTNDDDVTLDGNATATGGTQTIDAGTGTLTAGAINKTTAGKLTLSGDTGITLSGDVVSIDDITIADEATATGETQTIDAGAGKLEALNTITKNNSGGLTLSGGAGVALASIVDVQTGSLTITDAVNAEGLLQASGAVELQNTANLADNVSGNGIKFIGAVTADGGSSQTFNAGTGKLEALNTITKNNSGGLTLSGGAGVELASAVDVQTGDLTVTDAIDAEGLLQAGGSVELQSTANLAGNVSGVGITFNDAVIADGGIQTIDAGTGTLTAMVITKTTAGKLTLGGDTGIALSGNVIGIDDITIADAATATGEIQTIDAGAGTLSAQTISKTTAGKLTLGGDTDITLTGNVTNNDDITLDDDATATGGTQTIDAGVGTLSAQAINKTTAGELTLGGDTGITLSGNVTGIDDITIADAATATGGVQTIDAGAGTLTVGVITKTTTGKLTLGGDTDIALSDNITSNDDITLDDAVTATGDIQTIDAGAGALTAQAINKTTAGKLTLSGDTGIALSGSVISIDDITIDDATTATGDSQTFDAGTGSLSAKAITKTTSGDLNLAGDSGISLSDNVSGIDNVTLENNVSLTGASNQTLTATNDKLHAMGTLTKTDSGDLTLTGGTGIELNGTVDVQQGSLTVQSSVTVTQNLLAKDDLILSNSATLVGTSDQQLKAAEGKLETGQLTKTGAGALILTADEINLNGAVANDARAINLQPGNTATAVRIGGTDDDIAELLELSAADLANLQDGFGSITIGLEAGTGAVTVDNGDTDVVFSDPTTIQTSGTITVASTIMGIDDASIELKGAGSGTTLNAGIYTNGETIRLCDNQVNGTTIVLDTTSLAASNKDGRVILDGPAGEIILSPDAGKEGTIVLNTNLVTTTNSSDIQLGADLTAEDVPETASIYCIVSSGVVSFDNGNDDIGRQNHGLAIETNGGDFIMGQNQKLTVVYGDLLINTDGGNVGLGDLTANGKIEVEAGAGTITLLRRQAADLLIFDESIRDTRIVEDSGLDFVAKDSIVFTAAAVELGGNSPLPQFASINPGMNNINGQSPGEFSGMRNTKLRSFPASLITSLPEGGSVVLDLKASGVSTANAADALAGVLAEQRMDVSISPTVNPAQMEQLARLNIYAKEFDDILAQGDAYKTYDDMDIECKLLMGETCGISPGRLSEAITKNALRSHQELFYAADGTTLRTEVINKTLQTDLNAFRKHSGAKAFDPAAFHKYLETSGAESLRYLNQLNTLINHVKQIGLTSYEYSPVINNALLRPIEIYWGDEIITTEQLKNIIKTTGNADSPLTWPEISNMLDKK